MVDFSSSVGVWCHELLYLIAGIDKFALGLGARWKRFGLSLGDGEITKLQCMMQKS